MEWMDHARTTEDERLERLSAWLDGELAAEEAATVAAHLETCDECQSLLAELHAVRAVLHSVPAPALPRSFELPDDLPIDMGEVPTSDLAAPFPFPLALVPPLEEELPPSAPDEWSAVAVATDARGMRQPARRVPRWVPMAQAAGGLVALLGLVLLLASVVANQPGVTTASSAANGATSSASVRNPNASGNQGSHSPTLAPTLPPSAKQPQSQPHGTQTYSATSGVPVATILGLALIALGVLFFVVGLLNRRRTRAAPPTATAPPSR